MWRDKSQALSTKTLGLLSSLEHVSSSSTRSLTCPCRSSSALLHILISHKLLILTPISMPTTLALPLGCVTRHCQHSEFEEAFAYPAPRLSHAWRYLRVPMFTAHSCSSHACRLPPWPITQSGCFFGFRTQVSVCARIDRGG